LIATVPALRLAILIFLRSFVAFGETGANARLSPFQKLDRQFGVDIRAQAPQRFARVDAFETAPSGAETPAPLHRVENALAGEGERSKFHLRTQMAGRIVRPVLARIPHPAAMGAGGVNGQAIAAVFGAACKEVFADGA
jgi:hypothetical protein